MKITHAIKSPSLALDSGIHARITAFLTPSLHHKEFLKLTLRINNRHFGKDAEIQSQGYDTMKITRTIKLPSLALDSGIPARMTT
ncbi:MAG: hypothetical protein Q8N30_07805 [Methylococcales bacterium]|nr:hypothetical protein [Methylococcales bacterium]